MHTVLKQLVFIYMALFMHKKLEEFLPFCPQKHILLTRNNLCCLQNQLGQFPVHEGVVGFPYTKVWENMYFVNSHESLSDIRR